MKYYIYESNIYKGTMSLDFPLDNFKTFVESTTITLYFDEVDSDFLEVSKNISLLCIAKDNQINKVYIEGEIQTLDENNIAILSVKKLIVTKNNFTIFKIDEEFFGLATVNYLPVIRANFEGKADIDLSYIIEQTNTILNSIMGEGEENGLESSLGNSIN